MDQKIIIVIADGANLFCTSTDMWILSVTICNELRKLFLSIEFAVS